VDDLAKTTTKIEVKAEQEQKAKEELAVMGYADPSMQQGYGNALTVYGATMGGGMPQQPQYGGGMGYGGQPGYGGGY
jgi:hypothetical protein